VTMPSVTRRISCGIDEPRAIPRLPSSASGTGPRRGGAHSRGESYSTPFQDGFRLRHGLAPERRRKVPAAEAATLARGRDRRAAARRHFGASERSCLDIRRHSIDIWGSVESIPGGCVTHFTQLHNSQLGSAGRWAPFTLPGERVSGAARGRAAGQARPRRRRGSAGRPGSSPGSGAPSTPGDTPPIRWPLRRPHGARVISETMSR
jgi:hypothetical protein